MMKNLEVSEIQVSMALKEKEENVENAVQAN
jgi:hypothetical protein